MNPESPPRGVTFSPPAQHPIPHMHPHIPPRGLTPPFHNQDNVTIGVFAGEVRRNGKMKNPLLAIRKKKEKKKKEKKRKEKSLNSNSPLIHSHPINAINPNLPFKSLILQLSPSTGGQGSPLTKKKKKKRKKKKELYY